jgi:hypothetical protein
VPGAGGAPPGYASWAIQRGPKDLDRRFWAKRGVEIIDEDLEVHIQALDDCLRALPPAGVVP